MYQLSTLLAKTAEKFPDKIALIIDDQRYSYKKPHELTHLLATSLLEKGISQGDCIAFLLPNSIEIILCYYACFMIGAIAVPVNVRFNNELIHHVLKHSKPGIFITTPDYYKQLLKDEKILKGIKECYLTSESDNYPEIHDFQKLLLSTSMFTSNSTREIDFEKPALLFFTSGTTGLPKTVVHNHRSLSQGTQNQITQIHINQGVQLKV